MPDCYIVSTGYNIRGLHVSFLVELLKKKSCQTKEKRQCTREWRNAAPSSACRWNKAKKTTAASKLRAWYIAYFYELLMHVFVVVVVVAWVSSRAVHRAN